MAPPHVVILGGGFAGLYAARQLARAPVRVTLIDQQNHHLFQPLLYQVATAALNPSDIAQPLRKIFRRQKNATVLLAEASSVDPAAHRVLLADGAIDYDFLIVATGATHSYFGHDDWSRHAPGLKRIQDALEIRRRILLAFEAAERETDPDLQRAWLTFVIVGGGPTGVELAGALGEISRRTLARDFRRINPTQARILLLEGLDRILTAYPPALSQKAQRQLERLGVEVRTGARVIAIDERGVSLGGREANPPSAVAAGRNDPLRSDERIPARTVLWSAGVQASPLARSLGVPLDKAGRVVVSPQLTVPGHDEIYVVGDLASLEQSGKPVPGVAPAAIQTGRHAARNIALAAAGRPLLPFRYRDKGSLATIGRASAVAQIGRAQLSGFTAWAMWLLIHIYFLIGFRSRLLVLFSWALAYLSPERGARLITGEEHPLLLAAPGKPDDKSHVI